MPEFQKTVTTIEKFYIALDRLYRPFVNQLVIQGRGRLAPAALEQALARAAAANPGVTLRTRGWLGRMRWVPGPSPRLSVHAADWDACSGDGAPFLLLPLDPHRGPSAELQLIETGADACLVFRSLHATMDGGGTRHWAEDVFRALRGEPLVGSDCAETDAEFAAGLNDAPFEMPASDALQPCGAWDPAAGPGRRWLRVSLRRSRTDHVLATIASVLARHATLHAAAAAVGHRDDAAPGVVRINIPADLRFFHPERRSTGNLIGAVFQEVLPDDPLELISERVRERLRNKEHARFPRTYHVLRWIPLRRMRILVQRAAERSRRTNRQQFSATVSYLGDFSPEPFATPDFTPRAAFFIPPVAQQGCFVTATRMGGTTELLVAMPEALWSNGRGAELVEALRAALSAP